MSTTPAGSPPVRQFRKRAGSVPPMPPERFTASLAKLGYNVSTAHRLLGVGRSTIYRMAEGQAVVPGSVMRLLDMYERHGIPPEHQP